MENDPKLNEQEDQILEMLDEQIEPEPEPEPSPTQEIETQGTEEQGDGDNVKEFSMSEVVAIADDAVLTFTGSDQYDVFVFAENGTKHAPYNEFRFEDNSIDINSSTGSYYLFLRKVIYKTLDMK